MPVKLTTSHPVVEEGGDTVWNVGTSVDEKGGYSYSVIKFHKDRPGVTGTMMIEDAQVRVFSQRLHFFWKSVSVPTRKSCFWNPHESIKFTTGKSI